MAKTKKKKSKKRSESKKKSKSKKKESTPIPVTDRPVIREGSMWDEALRLETTLEEKLLEDAILSARLAIQELEAETRKMPYERRSGLRLKEKAAKTERAFNRLRALRKGELIPAQPDD